MRPRHYGPILIGFALAANGCASPSDPMLLERDHGVISFPELSSLPFLSIGPPLRVGVPTMIAIRTLGSSTCARPAGMDVSYTSAAVTLTPWVHVPEAGTPCTDDIASHRHEAIVTFSRAGTNRVTVYGYKREPGGQLVLGTISVDVTVDP